MVTKQQALAAYNSQHGTNYATVQELAQAVVMKLLREAWASAAYENASKEEIT